jgi:23S rRNA U2552 (ribose-2'-O)-methylase RlmE/FtsJ
MKKLQEVYEKYSCPHGWGDKGTLHSYIDMYESEMIKKKKVSLLEIGVAFGHSIKMWEDYFQDSNIYGIDIKNNSKFDLQNFILGDATCENDINKNFSRKKFDYVVDDGSHKVDDQIQSFLLLSPKMKKSGKYFIEDVDGDESLKKICDYLNQSNFSFKIFDLRSVKNRYDDLVVMIQF